MDAVIKHLYRDFMQLLMSDNPTEATAPFDTIKTFSKKLRKLCKHAYEDIHKKGILQVFTLYFELLDNYANACDNNGKVFLIVRDSLEMFLFVLEWLKIEDKFAKHIIKLIGKMRPQSSCLKEFLRMYAELLNRINKEEVIDKLSANEKRLTFLFQILTCPNNDIELQVSIMNIILILYHDPKNKVLKNVSPELSDLINSVASQKGNVSCKSIRKVLNGFNLNNSNMFSIYCGSIKWNDISIKEYDRAPTFGIWLDFDLANMKISFFCSKGFLKKHKEVSFKSSTNFELISFHKMNITDSAFLLENGSDFVINIKLKCTSINVLAKSTATDDIERISITIPTDVQELAVLTDKILPNFFERVCCTGQEPSNMSEPSSPIISSRHSKKTDSRGNQSLSTRESCDGNNILDLVSDGASRPSISFDSEVMKTPKRIEEPEYDQIKTGNIGSFIEDDPVPILALVSSESKVTEWLDSLENGYIDECNEITEAEVRTNTNTGVENVDKKPIRGMFNGDFSEASKNAILPEIMPDKELRLPEVPANLPPPACQEGKELEIHNPHKKSKRAARTTSLYDPKLFKTDILEDKPQMEKIDPDNCVNKENLSSTTPHRKISVGIMKDVTETQPKPKTMLPEEISGEKKAKSNLKLKDSNVENEISSEKEVISTTKSEITTALKSDFASTNSITEFKMTKSKINSQDRQSGRNQNKTSTPKDDIKIDENHYASIELDQKIAQNERMSESDDVTPDLPEQILDESILGTKSDLVSMPSTPPKEVTTNQAETKSCVKETSVDKGTVQNEIEMDTEADHSMDKLLTTPEKKISKYAMSTPESVTEFLYGSKVQSPAPDSKDANRRKLKANGAAKKGKQNFITKNNVQSEDQIQSMEEIEAKGSPASNYSPVKYSSQVHSENKTEAKKLLDELSTAENSIASEDEYSTIKKYVSRHDSKIRVISDIVLVPGSVRQVTNEPTEAEDENQFQSMEKTPKKTEDLLEKCSAKSSIEGEDIGRTEEKPLKNNEVFELSSLDGKGEVDSTLRQKEKQIENVKKCQDIFVINDDSEEFNNDPTERTQFHEDDRSKSKADNDLLVNTSADSKLKKRIYEKRSYRRNTKAGKKLKTRKTKSETLYDTVVNMVLAGRTNNNSQSHRSPLELRSHKKRNLEEYDADLSARDLRSLKRIKSSSNCGEFCMDLMNIVGNHLKHNHPDMLPKLEGLLNCVP